MLLSSMFQGHFCWSVPRHKPWRLVQGRIRMQSRHNRRGKWDPAQTSATCPGMITDGHFRWWVFGTTRRKRRFAPFAACSGSEGTLKTLFIDAKGPDFPLVGPVVLPLGLLELSELTREIIHTIVSNSDRLIVYAWGRGQFWD